MQNWTIVYGRQAKTIGSHIWNQSKDSQSFTYQWIVTAAHQIQTIFYVIYPHPAMTMSIL